MRVSYSEESKVKAVRLYWKLGSYSHTVDQLGYSSLHILRTWVRTRTRQGNLYKRADKRVRTVRSTYTGELRLQVVQAVLDEGLTVAQAAHRFHVVSKEIIYRWINVYRRAKSVDMIPRDTPHTPQASVEQPCSPLSTGSTWQENASPTPHQYYESLPDDMQTLKQQLAQAQLAAARLELELIKKNKVLMNALYLTVIKRVLSTPYTPNFSSASAFRY